MTRIYADPQGGSHFETLPDLVFEDAGDLGKLSKKLNTTGLFIHEYGANLNIDFHVSVLGSIYVIPIEGQLEIETTDGEKRIFGYGDILLEEGMPGGRGVRSRAYGNRGGKSIVLTLE